MEKVIVLEISFGSEENPGTIYPTLLADDQHVVLVDCGYVGFFPLVEKALRQHGYDGSDLTHIVITHHDHDHMGCLADFKKKYPKIKVVASALEEPYIAGKKKSLRLEQAEARQSQLPEAQKPGGQHFINILKSVQPVPVDIIVSDGEELPWVGGTRIIATPGHMPGHISLYLEKFNTVVAGDAATYENGRLAPDAYFSFDVASAEESLKKLLRLYPEKIICYHGGPVALASKKANN